MSFTYKYPQPSITGDVIVWDRRGDRILLIKRGGEPFKDCWAIVGGFFNPGDENGPINGQIDETVRDAAIRELQEEVGIVFNPNEKLSKFSLSFLTVQDKPNRDPRGRVVTLVYVLTIWDGVEGVNIKAADDAAECRWFDKKDIVDGKVPLAFDHLDSIQKFARGLIYL